MSLSVKNKIITLKVTDDVAQGMFYALLYGKFRVELMALLDAGFIPNAEKSSDNLAYVITHWSSTHQIKVVNRLIELGASPNRAENSDTSPLHALIYYPGGGDFFKLAFDALMSAGMDLSLSLTKKASNVLHVAAERTDINRLNIILDTMTPELISQKINAVNADGFTPLSLLVLGVYQRKIPLGPGCRETLKTLVSHGASLHGRVNKKLSISIEQCLNKIDLNQEEGLLKDLEAASLIASANQADLIVKSSKIRM